MKKINIILAGFSFIISSIVSAQDVKPVFVQDGELIKGTFYYEDGSISQEGTYKNGKLHGEWVSYDQNGKKIAMANYEEGKKTGTWFFWNLDQLTEVDYNESRITEVKTYSYQGDLLTRR